MLAVVSWQCVCGLKVKAMYETDGKTTIRCPTPSCRATHIVDGKISEIWVDNDGNKWTAQDVAPLLVP